jgi:NAD(P)H-dependent flavin oxidoreductase YrpB (nitropropane dioxygenase family)
LRVVSFMWGDPGGYIEAVHDAGGVAMVTVGSAEEARRAVASGADVVVAQGWEAGGHVWGTIATLPLVPAVVDAVAPVPVIAAGGIGDARGVAAVLAPDDQRPGQGDVIAHFASGEAIVRYEPAPPMAGTTGDIEALSMWAGQSVALARQPQPAADIVTELTSRL